LRSTRHVLAVLVAGLAATLLMSCAPPARDVPLGAPGEPQAAAGSDTADAAQALEVGTKSLPLPLDLATLGQNLTPGFWTPRPSFATGTARYFDPAAPPGGDGSRARPWRALAADLGRFLAAARPGDVAVLLPGDHGDVAIAEDRIDGWVGIVGAGPGVQLRSLHFLQASQWYVENVLLQKYRDEFPDPGFDAPDSLDWFDSAPGLVELHRTDQIVLYGCTLQAQAEPFATATGWNTRAPDGVRSGPGSRGRQRFHLEASHLQNLNYGIKNGFCDSSTVVGNHIHHVAGDMIQHGQADAIWVAGNFMHDFFMVNNNHCGMNQFWMNAPGVVRSGFYYGGNRFVESVDPLRVRWLDGGPDVDTAGGNGPYWSAGNDRWGYGVIEDVLIENNVHISGGWNFVWLKNVRNVTIRSNTFVPYWSGQDAHPEDYPNGHPLIDIDQRGGFTQSGIVIASNVGCGLNLESKAGVTVAGNWWSTEHGTRGARDFTEAGFVAWWIDNAKGPADRMDLRIASKTSPLVDAADPRYAAPVDRRGVVRARHDAPDIGAYEFTGSGERP